MVTGIFRLAGVAHKLQSDDSCIANPGLHTGSAEMDCKLLSSPLKVDDIYDG